MGPSAIERLQERAALHSVWSRAERTAQRVVIYGPEGVGKSRLVAYFEGPVEATGGVFLGVQPRSADERRALSTLTSIAYEIVTEDFDEASLGASRALLHAIATSWTNDETIADATQRLLLAVSAGRRMVLAIDDADRADAETIRILSRVALPTGCVTVSASREPVQALGVASDDAVLVELLPLTLDDIAVALARALGEADLAMAREIFEASGGKPALVAALIELARARHHLRSWTERSEAHVAGLLARSPSDREDRIASFVARYTRPAAPALDGDDGSPPDPPTFWNDGSTWVVTYAGARCVVPDTRGVRCLAHLVANPNVSIHVYELPAAGNDARGPVPSGHRPADGDPGPLLDNEATGAYRQRIRDLSEEMDEAERFNDTHRAAKLRAELEQLTQMLTSALGLGGRSRRHRWEAERARVAATKAIRSTISRLATMHDELGAHLNETIRTGFFCSYTPTEDATVAPARESHDVESVPFQGYTGTRGVTP